MWVGSIAIPPGLGNLLLTTESEKSSSTGVDPRKEKPKKSVGEDEAFDVSKFHGYGREYQL